MQSRTHLPLRPVARAPACRTPPTSVLSATCTIVPGTEARPKSSSDNLMRGLPLGDAPPKLAPTDPDQL